MTKIDELITKFREFKEELAKNINMSYSKAPNVAKDEDMQMAEKLDLSKNGQWKITKAEKCPTCGKSPCTC